MSATLIERGVRVTPDSVDEKDTLELAEALIEEHGWVQGTGGGESQGWSLHGAIGEAAKRLTGGYSKDNHEARKLRDDATDLLRLPRNRGLGRKLTDIEFNDKAKDVDEVLAVIKEAR